MDELRQAETLQRAVWGDGDLPDPADLMLVIQSEGGLVAGAFMGARLVGYIFGFPTREPGVQYSHRLGVRPDARGLGLGLGLKRYQRNWCLSRGIDRIRWTFDPLQALNATLNIHRLGAVSNTYLVDHYGEMGGINAGLASDRLLVEWHLASPLVAHLARGEMRPHTPATRVEFALPDDLAALTITDHSLAASLRHGLRKRLQQCFADGFHITDFDRTTRTYLVARS